MNNLDLDCIEYIKERLAKLNEYEKEELENRLVHLSLPIGTKVYRRSGCLNASACSFLSIDCEKHCMDFKQAYRQVGFEASMENMLGVSYFLEIPE